MASGLNSKQNKMSQLPLSCAKTSLPAPGGMRFLSLLPHRLTFKVLRVGSCGAASHFSSSWEGMSQIPLHPAGLPPCIDGGGSFILSLWVVFLFLHLKSPLVWLGFITSKEDPPISIPGEKDTREAGRSSNLHWGWAACLGQRHTAHREKRGQEGTR